MPMYLIASKNAFSTEQCEYIVKTITDVHCEMTKAPPEFVNVIFTVGRSVARGKQVTMLANVRNGGNRDDQSLEALRVALQEQVAAVAKVSSNKVGVQLLGVPANWNMEGGEILPDPGDETEWLAR